MFARTKRVKINYHYTIPCQLVSWFVRSIKFSGKSWNEKRTKLKFFVNCRKVRVLVWVCMSRNWFCFFLRYYCCWMWVQFKKISHFDYIYCSDGNKQKKNPSVCHRFETQSEFVWASLWEIISSFFHFSLSYKCAIRLQCKKRA